MQLSPGFFDLCTLQVTRTHSMFMGYIMSISMCMQNFITIFHSVQEIGPFSLFKVSTDEKCHFTISWARSCNINVYAKVYQNIPVSSRERAIFICPLFKKSDRSLACNYCPVSLTCVPCKLFEHIVYSNIMAHLDEYKLLSDRQHAFRKGHSCETQLTTVINYWAKILDNRGQVDTFILDFEKTFDTLPHELLKSKSFSYGIGGKTLKWIDSFLCFRQQRVVLNGVKSDWAPVLSGVPQGTVLGPLLFSLYINDISSDIESEIRLFADDCVCYREIKDEEDTMKLQRNIDRLGSWARKRGMRFQPVKCNVMQLTRKRIKKIHASYTLEGTDLENVESIKYLVVTITSDLRWRIHVSNICTKANRTLGFLRRNLCSCPQEVKRQLIKDWCAQSWIMAVYQQMTLSPKLGVVGISTLWHFRLPLPIQMFIKVAFFP